MRVESTISGKFFLVVEKVTAVGCPIYLFNEPSIPSKNDSFRRTKNVQSMESLLLSSLNQQTVGGKEVLQKDERQSFFLLGSCAAFQY
jgi:hypothetical protein